jgi:hypothetical protein
VHEHARVEAVEPGRPARLRVGGASLLADAVFVALNAYAPALVTLPLRLTPALTLAVCTEALEPAAIAASASAELALLHPRHAVSQPRAGDGRIVLGGPATSDAGGVAELALDGADGATSLGRLEARIARFTRRWPASRPPALGRSDRLHAGPDPC